MVKIKEEPRSREGGEGEEGGGSGQPLVRLPTYTHMIKQALTGG
jgi:hypothetical protein